MQEEVTWLGKHNAMNATVAHMTRNELQEMIGTVVEQKLVELLGDPDEGLPLKKALHARLICQKTAVARGERGERLEDLARRLDLD
jgi:hypothetical protein